MRGARYSILGVIAAFVLKRLTPHVPLLRRLRPILPVLLGALAFLRGRRRTPFRPSSYSTYSAQRIPVE